MPLPMRWERPDYRNSGQCYARAAEAEKDLILAENSRVVSQSIRAHTAESAALI
jgi:hypothetical protein